MDRKLRFGTIITTLAVLVLGPAAGLGAGTPSDTDQGPGQVKQGAKEIGRGVEDTAKGIGNTVSEGATKAGERVQQAAPDAKSVGDELHGGQPVEAPRRRILPLSGEPAVFQAADGPGMAHGVADRTRTL